MSNMRRLNLAVLGGLLLAFTLCLGALIIWALDASKTAGSLVKVGQVDEFPPGSVTALSLPATFWDPDPPAIGGATPGAVTQLPRAAVEPVPIWLVNSPEVGLVALYRRDPYRGCQVAWEEPNRRFVNPCHGQKYTETGAWIEGQSERNLDQFAVVLNDAGQVWVDVGQYHEGERLPLAATDSRRP